ncbi:hypothetical protein GQ53DRAFT_786313 [Thozetella sp. PMI_491]|nr:hypothetical protein GQ53DRAFT_786313 [Thozetella sp. PMI_491]
MTTAFSLPASAGSDPCNLGSSSDVLEFMCLFTHDLRRKQKRWQDGRLKYHAFNKRVMVYDERGNFVGDMHWRAEHHFDEGEEVQLERGGILVQVSECVGRKTQDLSELLDKRVQEREQRQARSAARPPSLTLPQPALSVTLARPQDDHFQLRHRPLHKLIGTPTGHHGRAVLPTESPFEQRQRSHDDKSMYGDERSAKRRRCDGSPPRKTGYAQSLFGTQLTLSADTTIQGTNASASDYHCSSGPQAC